MPRLTLLDAGNLREPGAGRSFIDPPSIWELACSFFLCLQKNRVIWAGRLMWSHLDIFHGCVWKNGKNLLLKNWTIRLEPTKGSSCDITYMSFWWGGVCESVSGAQFLLEGKKVWCDLVCECVYRISVWVCFGLLLVNICLKHLDMPVLLKLWYALVLICVAFKFRVTFALAHVHFCPGVSKTHYQ